MAGDKMRPVYSIKQGVERMRYMEPSDCLDCFKEYGYDRPFTMACFIHGHKGTHHFLMEEE
jgi:hypothetical protein